ARLAVESLSSVIPIARGDSLVFVANVVATLVERGADAEVAEVQLTDRLIDLTAQARDLIVAARVSASAVGPASAHDDEAVEEARVRLTATTMPDAGRAWNELEGLLAASIGIYGATARGRARAAVLLPNLDDLAENLLMAHWLGRFLRVLYDEPYVVIE